MCREVIRDFPPGCRQLAAPKREEIIIQKDLHQANVADMSSSRPFCGRNVRLPHCRTVTSNVKMRSKVRETLRLFRAVLRQLLQKFKGESNDKILWLAAMVLKTNKRCLNCGEPIIGPVPGVGIGDSFQHLFELQIIGLHSQTQQHGVGYIKQGERIIATSIVAAGKSMDNIDNTDEFTYVVQGGDLTRQPQQPEDEDLETATLALENSRLTKNPVRLIHLKRTYVFDGLFLIQELKQRGLRGKTLCIFKLFRIPGQC